MFKRHSSSKLLLLRLAVVVRLALARRVVALALLRLGVVAVLAVLGALLAVPDGRLRGAAVVGALARVVGALLRRHLTTCAQGAAHADTRGRTAVSARGGRGAGAGQAQAGGRPAARADAPGGAALREDADPVADFRRTESGHYPHSPWRSPARGVGKAASPCCAAL